MAIRADVMLARRIEGDQERVDPLLALPENAALLLMVERHPGILREYGVVSLR